MWLAGTTALVVAALAAPQAAGAPTPEPYRTNDFGGFNAILPPGANGLDNALQLANFLATGARPPHNNDQYAAYGDLVYANNLTPGQIPNHFHDASFGVPSGQVERQYSPRGDVTVQRDSLGIPHVYGDTRAGAIFGLGYIGAEDRLFFMDALRNAGRGQLSSFAGGAEGNRHMDEEVWADTPYTEADLTRQCAYSPAGFEAETAQLRQDVINYVAGINQYISEARLDPTMMPGEYAAINRPQGPEDWKCEDVIATAALVGGIFGKGGGGDLDSALVLQAAKRKFGAKAGKQVWADFRNAEDPEAPTMVHRKKFAYGKSPRRRRGVMLPDRGSLRKSEVVARSSAPPTRDGAATEGLLAPLNQLYGGGPLRAGASNALLVSARESEGGKPAVVMGPQVAYFSPQILLEQDVHAPTLQARGAAFPGVNLFVLLGRGPDYAWSATSAGQDIIDTFAVRLCDPAGGSPTVNSSGYVFRGQCLPFEVLTKTISWAPSPADPTPPGSETLRTERSKLGVVIARAKVKGKPFAFTKLRSTYFHEADSALGFSSFNNPDLINSPRDFQRAANLIAYTFNWFYADDRNIAYLNSGWNPVRAKRTDPNLPINSKFEWRGFQADSLAGATPFPVDFTPFKRHPQVINQRFISSWNNKQAPKYRAADNNWNYGPVYRSITLDERIRRLIKGKRKASLTELIGAMIDAATVDLRGHTVLPHAIRIMRSKPIRNPAVRAAVAKLAKWEKAGAHREDFNRDGSYENSDAIRLLDAWWEPMLRAEFQPRLGKNLFDEIEGMTILDDSPNLHLGSAYNGGWYVYANKDLRTILAKRKGKRALRRIEGRDSRVYCGKGRFGRCRRALLNSLQSVLGSDPYGENADCGLGSRQMCFDAIHFRSTGGITQPDMVWQNRPTFQQALQVQGHR